MNIGENSMEKTDKKKQISVIVDEKILNEFDDFCKDVGITRSGAISLFMRYCAINGSLPFTPRKRAANGDALYLHDPDEPTYSMLREQLAKYQGR